jgi:glycerol-3-phosphate dehydrogenase
LSSHERQPLALSRREQNRKRLQREVFDLAVVGGGINGAAIARDAALRGYRVCLLEQRDFAFGTSSRSSRLIHGGLRYLEQGQVGLVFESVSERALLAQLARHIVRPIPFVFPVYRDNKQSLTLIDVGLWLYDGLALFRNYQLHKRLGTTRTTAAVPGLREDALTGSVLYYDYQTDDARLVLENVLSAAAIGVAVLSYAKVEGFERKLGRVKALRVREQGQQESFAVRCRAVVCAAGPWTDRVLALTESTGPWLRPTKGIHMVVPRDRLAVDCALAIRHPVDGRVHFILPYHERTVVGTTDTDFFGDPDDVQPSRADVEYLLASANHYFAEAKLKKKDVIACWAGVRPLLAQDSGNPSAVSREHEIDHRPDGIVVIAGGKLTTYRRMAEQCVDVAQEAIVAGRGPSARRGVDTRNHPLPGAEGLASDEDLDQLVEDLSGNVDSHDTATHLALTYGVRARNVLAVATEDKRLAQRVAPDLPHIWAEVTFAARHELAFSLCDTLIRRTQLFYRDLDQGLGLASRACELMAAELGWDDRIEEHQLLEYRDEVAKNRAWREKR